VTSHDLSTRTDIHDLVVEFYRAIVNDAELGYIFGEVAEVDWTLHIPKLIDYWCRVLLHQPGYDGYILAAHQHVHDIEPIPREMFDRWYLMWLDSIDSRWEGPIADKAKSHAAKTMKMLAHRLRDDEWSTPDHLTFADIA
jgi:hemoglobin